MITRITHVDFGNDYGKVHRLLKPTDSLHKAYYQKVACGRTYHGAPFSAGWTDYDESKSWMCEQCRKVAV